MCVCNRCGVSRIAEENTDRIARKHPYTTTGNWTQRRRGRKYMEVIEHRVFIFYFMRTKGGGLRRHKRHKYAISTIF